MDCREGPRQFLGVLKASLEQLRASRLLDDYVLMMLKVLNLLALLGAVAWLARHPDWEPAITSIALLAALIASEVSGKRRENRNRLSEIDKALFQKFCEELPSDGKSVKFLLLHDLGTSFHDEQLMDIYNFVDCWTNAEYEFQNKRLEEKKKELYRLLNDFIRELAEHSFPSHREGWNSLELEDFETRPEKLALRDHLNEMATNAYQAHQDLVKEGRRLLN
jgi:hypothetical protein